MTQTILTTLALCFSLVTMPVLAQVNVKDDLISFSRWTSDANGDDAGTALYTLTKGTTTCTALQGGEQTLLRFKDQVSLVCQIGEVTGKESNVWDNTVKLKWKTPEACKANTVLFFGEEQAKRNTEDDECDLTQLRNYEIPDKATLAGQANGGKIAVKLGMEIGGGDQSQDLIIGYWTPAASSTPECSDESIDWTTAATEDGWSCTVDGTEYEYADFHVLFTTNDAGNVCGTSPGFQNNQLPTEGPLFCKQTGTSIKAIFDWDNPLVEGEYQHLNWLQSVE